jgi:hypothetical protein
VFNLSFQKGTFAGSIHHCIRSKGKKRIERLINNGKHLRSSPGQNFNRFILTSFFANAPKSDELLEKDELFETSSALNC